MSQQIAHRGPDGKGLFVDRNMGMVHRRLAILDTSERGAQPMHSSKGNWVLSFNGCIYNFKELRKEMQQAGIEFRSNSDTEVIVEGLELHGPEFFKRFNGMFAIAAYHKPSNTLYLSRDRFGVKPLYYWFNGTKLVFASEIKAIIQDSDYQIDIDFNALNEYFTFQNLFSYQSIFKGIVLLPPANTIEINCSINSVKHSSWWDYEFYNPDESMSFEEAKEETQRLFKQAVQRQMISDVPVGSYLSGGMDSGSIASLARSQVDTLTTFTCGFDMSAATGYEVNYDERRDAELMASIFETEHYEQVIGAKEMTRSIDKVVYHLEEPRVGMSYPNYYIARLASKFVKVCLQGTGGDELYGGYPWRYYRIFDSVNQQAFLDQYYDFWQRLVLEKDKDDLFNTHYRGLIDFDRPRAVFDRVFTFNKKLKYDSPEDHIQNSLYFEIKTFLPGLLLVGDRLSMANGLEERFPFLDNDLVNFAQRIPIRHKLGNLKEKIRQIDENTATKKKQYQEFDDGKNVLRKAMKEFMPEQIINRKKQGFSAPDESWYRKGNTEYIEKLLLGKDTLSQEFVSRDYIRKIVDEHVHKGANHRLLIWSFMNFEWWCKIFLNNQRVE